MSLSADAWCKMSDVELLAAHVEARRQFVEKKFTRDTHQARLAWIEAKEPLIACTHTKSLSTSSQYARIVS